MIRIWADFNTQDQGRVALNTIGSLKDIDRHRNEIAEGLKVILRAEDEFEVEATLTFDGIWYAIPDMSTIRYLESDNRA